MLMMKYSEKKLVSLLIILGLVSYQANAQEKTGAAKSQPMLYSKGVKAPASNFTGTVWVNMLTQASDQLDSSIGSVTFEPGARTNWHLHPGGQVLLVTDGKGLYQEKGGPVKVIRKGDVIKCPPGIAHWHGAAPKRN
jgi:quercetin dioxygenase-like cupin family protein